MADMDVNIVDVDREMWSGKATFIFTRTTVGEIGDFAPPYPVGGGAGTRRDGPCRTGR